MNPIYDITQDLTNAPARIAIDLPVLQGYANSIGRLLNLQVRVEGRESGHRTQYRFQLTHSHLTDQTWRTYGTTRQNLLMILNLLNGAATIKGQRRQRNGEKVEIADMTWR